MKTGQIYFGYFILEVKSAIGGSRFTNGGGDSTKGTVRWSGPQGP